MSKKSILQPRGLSIRYIWCPLFVPKTEQSTDREGQIEVTSNHHVSEVTFSLSVYLLFGIGNRVN